MTTLIVSDERHFYMLLKRAMRMFLIERGANFETPDISTNNPLRYAARGSHESTVQLLLNTGAEIEAKDT
jgi:ankyrin repeat protein